MSQEQQYKEKFFKPELFLSEVIRQSSQGFLQSRGENPSLLSRATVAAVDVIGGLLENPDGQGKVSHVFDGKSVEFVANIGPVNPKNSIKARIISEGSDQFITDDRLRVFWPLFPEHMSIPIKPGEHVYVMFEDIEMEHGLWVGKVPGQENFNFFRGQDSFKDPASNSLANKFDDSRDVGSDPHPLKTDEDAGESKVGGNLSSLFA
jgi:hypothetical protein